MKFDRAHALILAVQQRAQIEPALLDINLISPSDDELAALGGLADAYAAQERIIDVLVAEFGAEADAELGTP